MATKIRTNTNPRTVIRHSKKIRIRKKIKLQQGKIARLVVYRSNKFLYAQLVDDKKEQLSSKPIQARKLLKAQNPKRT